MKILVTGANGFVGQHLVKKLNHAGHDVGVLVRKDEGFFQDFAAARIYNYDISTSFKIAELFDVVIHLAAYNFTHVGNPQPSLYTQMNVHGTEHVLQGTRSARFIFLSTAKVYTKQAGLITEEGDIAPVGPYEQSKRQAEELCLRLANDRKMILLRSTNVFGPGQPNKAVIPIFFKNAMNAEPIKVFAPRGSWLQFLYVDDLVSAIERSIAAPCNQGIFNVASSEVVRLEDLALMVKKITRSSAEIDFQNNASEARIEISCSKIKEEMGWQASMTLEGGLRHYYEYAQKHSA